MQLFLLHVEKFEKTSALSWLTFNTNVGEWFICPMVLAVCGAGNRRKGNPKGRGTDAELL